MDIQRRELIGAAELRAESRDDTGRPILRGLAAPFNQESNTLREGGRTFREVLRPGAFARSLGIRPVVALIGHQPYPPIGSTAAGTLRLRETARGLEFELDPPTTPAGELTPAAAELVAAVASGNLRGMSFGFNPAPNGATCDIRGETPLHVLTDVDVYEISFVTFPAYPATSVTAAIRSLEQFEREQSPPPPPRSAALEKLAAILSRS